MSLKINNETITASDLTGGNSDLRYFNSSLHPLIPNKIENKLLGSTQQTALLKQWSSDSINHTLTYTPKITNIVNPGDNENLFETLSKTHYIYSSFSKGTYFRLSEPFKPGNNPWSITMRLKTPASFSYRNAFFGSTGSASSDWYKTVGGEINTSSKFGAGITYNGTSWAIWLGGTTTLTASTWYLYRLSFTGSQYKLESKKESDSNWTLEAQSDSTTPIYQGDDSILCFGHQGTSGTDTYLRGEFDLTTTKIIIGNEVWFDGSNPTYSISGSPTISNSMASGFSSANYLSTLNTFGFSSANNWEIELQCETGALTGSNQLAVLSDRRSPTGIRLYILEYSKHFGLYLSKSSWGDINDPTSSSGIKGNTTLQANTKYYVKIQFTGTAYKVLLKENENDAYIEDSVITSSEKVNTNTLMDIGRAQDGYALTSGSFDLSSLKMTIDNSLVFSGSTNIFTFGAPTVSTTSITEYIFLPFEFSFDLNSSILSQGTKLLLEHPNLIKVKTENNILYFNFPWKNANKWYYLPDNILVEGANSISLTGDSSRIKLIVNSHNFTLADSDLPLITTGVLGYKEDLDF